MSGSTHPEIVDDLVEQLRQDGEKALADQFAEHRPRLWKMVDLRLDLRLRGRVDGDDVLQEAYLDAVQRLDHYLGGPPMSFFIWLRLIVCQTLINVHRRHLGVKQRDAARERSLSPATHVAASSVCLAAELIGQITSPSQAAVKAELVQRLDEALQAMNPVDREVLVLRHFEDLTNGEVAELLGIQQKAASIRYVRAIARLKTILERLPEFVE